MQNNEEYDKSAYLPQLKFAETKILEIIDICGMVKKNHLNI